MSTKNTNKTKKESESLTDVLTGMTSDLKMLLEDYHDKDSKWWDDINKLRKKKNTSRKDIRLIREDTRKITQSTEAVFIYMLSVFERNLRPILRVIVKKNKNIREKFNNKWDAFINKKDLLEHGLNYKDFYTNNNYKFEHFDILSRDENRDPINFIETLTGIRKLSEKEGVLYLKHLSAYFWYKEIRNLLVHRGVIFDSTFIKTIKKTIDKNTLSSNHYDPDSIIRLLALNQFNFEERRELNKLNDEGGYVIKTKNIIDRLNGRRIKSLPLYNLTCSLLFISSWLVYNNNKRVKNGFSVITSTLGIMTEFNKSKNGDYLNIHQELIESLSVSCHNSDIKKISDSDKLNLLIEAKLNHDRLIKDLNKSTKYSSEELKMKRKTIRDEMKKIYDAYFQFNKMPINMIEVLDAFIYGSKKTYTEKVLKTNFKEIAFFYNLKNLKGNLDENVVRGWLLFNKYSD